MDHLLLQLTQTTVWVQLPILLAVIMPLAGLGALLLLRAIDWAGRACGRWFGNARARK